MVTWIDALGKTRHIIAKRIRHAFRSGPTPTEEDMEELESTLIRADVPARLAAELIESLEKSYKGLDVSRMEVVRRRLLHALDCSAPPFTLKRAEQPTVFLVSGVNGSGKTTTCAKLAHQWTREGRTVLLGAADTFRAAGSEQLKRWGDRLSIPVVAGAPGGDAASVAYDAVDAAAARNCDAVIIDTAGRMHTKKPLMDELLKMHRAIDKRVPGAPHENWIVLDASVGQNGVAQARFFHDLAPLTGAVVAKLDGSSRAGFVFSIVRDLGIPIRYAGLGEGEDDLVPFDAEAFVSALLKE